MADHYKLNSSGIIEFGGANNPGWMSNVGIFNATTTNANDSISIKDAGGASFSSTNPGWLTIGSATAGQLTTFEITSDITINLTGAHWENGTRGDLTDAILRVLAINDNGTLRIGVALLGGRDIVLTTDTNATGTNINLAEEVLCDTAVASALNSVSEIGYFRANFDDTGGAAEDLWTVQSGSGDIVVGKSADGLWQPFNPSFSSGFSAGPTVTSARWMQVGRTITVDVKITGTSNSTAFPMTPPCDTRRSHFYGKFGITDNGSAQSDLGIYAGASGAATGDIRRDGAATAYTNSGTKAASGTMYFEVGPAASFIP